MNLPWNEIMQPAFGLAILQIIWIDILLAGDNAVVIALACRMLPPHQRLWGMILGAGVAVLLRVFFTLIVVNIMALPYLKLIGGILLLYIAVKLVLPGEAHSEDKITASESLWRAVRIIAIADIVMSLDNVIAIAATAESAAARMGVTAAAENTAMVMNFVKTSLIIFGLALSIPLIVAGSALLMSLLERFPILVWAGAGILGWIAGEIMIKDSAVIGWLGAEFVQRFHYWAAVAGVVFVVGVGYLLVRSRRTVRDEV